MARPRSAAPDDPNLNRFREQRKIMTTPTDYSETVTQLRDTVERVCKDFPGEYWRAKDREREYPTEFVQALTDLGLLAALIPEEYGGSGLPLSMGVEILKAIH
jgi:alkylation response protein AidB-like acyl-CoA dehydrogenase